MRESRRESTILGEVRSVSRARARSTAERLVRDRYSAKIVARRLRFFFDRALSSEMRPRYARLIARDSRVGWRRGGGGGVYARVTVYKLNRCDRRGVAADALSINRVKEKR